AAFPQPLLGALLLVSGVELASSVRHTRTPRGYSFAMITAAAILALDDTGAGFLLGLMAVAVVAVYDAAGNSLRRCCVGPRGGTTATGRNGCARFWLTRKKLQPGPGGATARAVGTANFGVGVSRDGSGDGMSGRGVYSKLANVHVDLDACCSAGGGSSGSSGSSDSSSAQG
ncbi:hypothetical protein Vretimale_8999, partial [Volvox reticuliferus]